MVAIVASALIAAFHRAPSPHARVTSPKPIVFTPISDQLDCLSDMAWSSNRQLLAVVGYSGGCPFAAHPYDAGHAQWTPAMYQGPLYRDNDGSGAVAIYDAQRGVRISAFAPDSAVYQAILSQASPAFASWLAQAGESPPGTFAINYTHVLWARGNQRIILAFTFYLPDSGPITSGSGVTLPGHIIQGLLVTDLKELHTQVMLATGGQQDEGAVIWDLDTGKPVNTEPRATPFATLPPSQTYSWSSDGTISPGAPLTTGATPSAAPLGAVGAPLAGAASFTAWQPGSIQTALSPSAPGSKDLTGVVTFAPNTAAFSPDGRYVITSIGIAGLVTGAQGATDPAITDATLSPYGWQSALRWPVRDAGLMAAISLIQANGAQVDGPDGYVAWRPDGRVIAVSSFAPDSAATLFDTATGKQMGSLRAPRLSTNPPPPTVGLLVWSPDGESLAYYDGFAVSLWSAALLPR